MSSYDSTSTSSNETTYSTGHIFYFRFGPPPPPPPPRRPELNAFDILGVPRGSPWLQVKSAYRHLAKLHHPDRGGDKRKMAVVNLAFEAIRDHPGYQQKGAAHA